MSAASSTAAATTTTTTPAPNPITITDPRIGPRGNEEFKIPLRIFNNGNPDDDIVISGIGGRYPDSMDIDEFWSKIMSGAELSTIDDRRWPVEYLGTPAKQGKLKDIDKMDYEFFNLKQDDANWMDPQIRLLHETVYEAITDAGLNPADLRGTNTAVSTGHCYDDTDSAFREDASKSPGFKQLSASRISYAFDLHGPVFCTDTACASSFSAFFNAVSCLRAGQADRALVCGAMIHLRPFTAVAFHNLKMLSDDGRCKCMDANADGYCRSEAVVTVLLQRRSQAKRVYANILNTRTNTDGFKQEGITFPSYYAQRKLMVETYSEIGMDPKTVEYMEAHMTGTPAGDPVESAAIADVCCPEDRTIGPLLMGCLKSSMGHAEGSSGMCAITKACMVFQRKELPANLFLTTPSPHIEGLVKGVLKPVTEIMKFEGKIIGVNSFGFGGVNVHAILEASDRDETADDRIISQDGLPRLVTFCGRTKEGVEHAFKFMEKNPDKMTKGFLGLLENHVKSPPKSGMTVRGYAVFDEGKKILSQGSDRTKEEKPLWFVFSALGCQWPAMAKALMPLPAFAESIAKSEEIINRNKLGYDIRKLILDEDEKLENIVEGLLAIVTVQIALVDLLFYLDLVPEGIVGHSVGEIASAYADGCMTQEQTLLTVYHTGKTAYELRTTRGGMAAVGLSWEQMEERLKDKKCNVYIGCNNTADTITLSGDEQEVKEMVKELVEEGIFAKEVDCCGTAFHSPLVKDAYEPLKKKLESVVPNPKPRSSRWLSTSVPQESWHEEEWRHLGPTYYPNCMLSPVRFCDVFQYIPKNAVAVEIGPHAILLSLLKRGLGPDASCIPLMKRNNNENNMQLLMSAIGKVYMAGINPSITQMYPKPQYPVPRETASISPLIKWDHSKDLYVTKFPDYFNVMKGDQMVSFDLMEQKNQFLAGHCIDGRVLFPATGYLWIIWQRMAMSSGYTNYEECPVEFMNVKFHRATMLPKVGQTNFKIILMETTGQFAITEGGSVCVTGFVREPEDASTLELENLMDLPDKDCLMMTTKEIYKDLRVRGYDYGPTFQGLVEAASDGSRGNIKWLGNWINFTDSMLQMSILGKKDRSLFLPTFIDYMKCDSKRLFEVVKNCKNDMGESVMQAKYDRDINAGFAAGMVIRGLKATPAPRRSNQVATIESYTFVPYEEKHLRLNANDQQKKDTYEDYCHRMLQIVETNNSNGLRENIEKDDNLKILLESSDDRHVLLKTLWQVVHGPDEDKEKDKEKDKDKDEEKEQEQEKETKKNEENPVVLVDQLRESMDKVSAQLAGDLLLTSALASENILRVHVDVVAENFIAKKMEITEANQSNHIMHDLMSEAIENVGLVCSNYTLLHADHEAMGKEHGLETSRLDSHFTKANQSDVIIFKDESTRFATHTPTDAKASEFSLSGFLKSAAASMKENAFALIIFRSQFTRVEEYACSLLNKPVPSTLKQVEEIKGLAEESGFEIISCKSMTEGTNSLLLRKTKELADETRVLIEVSMNEYAWVDQVKEHLLDKDGQEKQKYKVWLIARDSASNGIVGLVNCIKRELTSERVRCIFSPPEQGGVDVAAAAAEELLTPELVKKDLVMNVYRSGEFGSYRHYTIDDIETFGETEHAYLDVKTKGDLSSLRWVDADHKFWPTLPDTAKQTNDLLISVHYAALNFKDVMVATGRIPVDAYPADFMGTGLIGMEFSGKDQRGRRVMAFCPSKAIATTLLFPESHFLWEVPNHWTMADAATVPVVYVTVYYALFIRGNLRSGESVLIHAGTGGIGQAAISVCLAHGCDVFTTVGSQAKREFLLKHFPQLKDSHIGNSRDVSFEEMIMKETDGRGVDMVLNSLADEKLQASIRCMADFGRFIELGKYDVIQNHKLNLSDMGRNKTFHVVCVAHLDFDALVNRSESAIRLCHKLHHAMDQGIKSGAIQPLKYHIFENTESEAAFRFMATGKHTGKVLIRMRDDEELGNLPQPVTKYALNQTIFHPLKSYIITGGLGGFGLELAGWMVLRGVRLLILTSRSGIKNSYQELAVRRLKSMGANVLVSTNDVSTREGTEALIEEASAVAPVGGILHLAMVLKDAMLENQSVESFTEACACKVQGTIHLDQVTRKSCPELEHFVCFSSVTSGRGNAGQTNYGFANSVMERTCEVRRKDGLPGMAIQWGAVGDVGVVAESLGGNDVIIGGTLPQRMPSCMQVLDSFLQSRSLVTASSIVKADKKRSAIGGKGDLLRQICHILGVKDPASLDPNTTLGDLGLDSLMAVEIRQALERDYDMVLSAQEVRQLKIKDIQLIGSKAAAAAGKKEGGKGGDGGSAGSSSSILPISLKEPPQLLQGLSVNMTGGKPIFFVPDMTDDFTGLKTIIECITRPVIGISWIKDVDAFESITDVAKYYVKNIREYYPDNIYDFLGIGFGSLIAHEMALEFQKILGSKSVHKLLFLNGSPSYCKKINSVASKFLPIADKDEAHIQSLLGFARFHFHQVRDLPALEQEIRSCSTREERIKCLSEYITKTTGNEAPVDRLDVALQRFCRKIKMAEEYVPSAKFVGQLRLFKPATPGYAGHAIDDLPADYGLGEMVDGSMDVHVLDGDHETFIFDHADNVGNKIDVHFQYVSFA